MSRHKLMQRAFLSFMAISIITIFGSKRYLPPPSPEGTTAATTACSTTTTNNNNNTHRHNDTTVPVFYNLFVASEQDSARVQKLVADQLSHLLANHHRVYLHSIGYPVDVPNAELLQHHESGTELETLHSLWEYCTIRSGNEDDDDTKVIYLHSKGSYHSSPQNDALRAFLTVGALSPDCLELPDACSVCSSRFSPLPHPHTPGNMWLARCSYIRRLVDPRLMEAKMSKLTFLPTKFVDFSPSCYGLGRYAAEHWVHSHPSCMPCDLSADARYSWAYDHVPSVDTFDKLLHMAPRFQRLVYEHRRYCKSGNASLRLRDRVSIGVSLQDRLLEYSQLYNASPTNDWWGWDLAATTTTTTVRANDKDRSSREPFD